MERVRATGLESAAKDILKHESPEIANVSRSVNGGAAAIKTKCGAVDRSEIALGSGQRVKKPHGGV